MKRAIPLYTFYKNKYGSELLIDIVELKDIKKFLVGKQAHTLSYYDITFITDGEGAFNIGNQTEYAVPRDVFFSKPGEVRSWDINHIANGFALIFEDEFLSSFFKDSLFVQHLSFFHPGSSSAKLHLSEELYARFLPLLQHIKKEIDVYQSNDVHVLRAMLYEALMLLNRAYQCLPADNGYKENGNPYMTRFISLINEYAGQQHSVHFYAEQLCITPNYLNELVSTTFNISAKQYIRNKVMEQAKNMLAYTHQPISEIAETLRFSTVSYFIRSFRQHTGTTPLLYRMEHQP